MQIELLEDISGHEGTAYEYLYKKGSIHEDDEPYQGLNKDGTWTFCRGMDFYITIKKHQFKIVKQ